MRNLPLLFMKASPFTDAKIARTKMSVSWLLKSIIQNNRLGLMRMRMRIQEIKT